MESNAILNELRMEDTPFDGVKIINPAAYPDTRGCFFEAWHQPRYEARGLIANFVQDNVVTSRRGVLRGLHFQYPKAQIKLVTILHGEVFDVVVDVRRHSPTYKRWFSVNLSAENHLQLWIGAGFAHGYQVLSEVAILSYKCSHVYEPSCDRTVFWADPTINILWPLPGPLLSAKDAAAPWLDKFTDNDVFSTNPTLIANTKRK